MKYMMKGQTELEQRSKGESREEQRKLTQEENRRKESNKIRQITFSYVKRKRLLLAGNTRNVNNA